MITAIIVAIVALSVLILAHELGHFLVAKKAGVWVEEFGLFLPPRLFGIKIGETLYSVNAIPLGGFVRLHGESGEDKLTKPGRAYVRKSKKAKAAVAAAGIITNFILAIFAFGVFYSFMGFPKETGRVEVVEVATDSPAQMAGLVPGDVIVKIGDQEVKTNADFIGLVNENKGKTVKIELEGKTVTVKPRENFPQDQGPVGVTITSQEIYFPPIWQRPFLGVTYGFKEAIFWGGKIFLGLGTIATDVSRGQAPKGALGPFGIILVLLEIFKQGVLPAVNFIGILSVNLAIINILPIPPFDGSRIAFIIVEAVTKKKMTQKMETRVYAAGFILVIGLFLFMTYREVLLLISEKSIPAFIEAILQ
ncbi:hypothetical protein A2630_03755 [Candidatus Woesebacteria bacterium RIFCSPHIGHO2_01_FULL_44_10]|uniref:PDZ domain-containing protein n=1 Tax=Candidatus Woesebacteria bacterium RIFCSPLOWO2_01_FULL_44_14 TaxID=1802525 RepID=A0A1F8C5F9_9BACT|nr:MAG: hypothetical protein A2630_03755 [Candidatus Woesebacteria bacterium RIFCSPHIGHO2_01_FULL_44_10]OGM55632.1 MAG: hypothetical protein A3F62_02365 [Candidatus Woesebacteria bacterium RIFCSPHIGHO2_12_FULL_44_11]OGM70905.1 MAG: hypothetical protein A2975_01355 [Candidatus Woesebacteria bacterium RIFCSPLOWO2_01_FULL_44_14]